MLPGMCIQLDTIVQTHESNPWCVSLFVFYGCVLDKQDIRPANEKDRHKVSDILQHGCGSSYEPGDWVAHGHVDRKSLADALHMHVAAPWVPKWEPRQLFLARTKDWRELMLIATNNSETAVLRACNADDATIRYYVDALSESCGTIVSAHKFQNPKDTRFVLLSHGDWDLDVEVASLQDLEADGDTIFGQRACETWVKDTTVCPARGDPVGVIDGTVVDCGDAPCRTLIGALGLCSVTVCHLGRLLQDTKPDAALLCRWFPEQLQRVFILEMDGNCVRLLCHGRSMQARITWMTS